MQKQVYDEKNGFWYELYGDYYLPCLTVPPEEQRPIGVWGQRHLRYLMQHRKVLYTELQISGKLNSYLARSGRGSGGYVHPHGQTDGRP